MKMLQLNHMILIRGKTFIEHALHSAVQSFLAWNFFLVDAWCSYTLCQVVPAKKGRH